MWEENLSLTPGSGRVTCWAGPQQGCTKETHLATGGWVWREAREDGGVDAESVTKRRTWHELQWYLELTWHLLAEVGGSPKIDFPESLQPWTEKKTVSDSSLGQEDVKVKTRTLESGFRRTFWAWASACSEVKDTEGEDTLLSEEAPIPLPKGQDQSGRKEKILWPYHCTRGEQLWLVPVQVLLGGAGRLRGGRRPISRWGRPWGRRATPFSQQDMEEDDTWISLSWLDPLITRHSKLLRAGGSHSRRKLRCRSCFLLLPHKEKVLL